MGLWFGEDLSLKAFFFFFYPHVNLHLSSTPRTGRREELCCLKGRDLPFLLKYLPLMAFPLEDNGLTCRTSRWGWMRVVFLEQGMAGLLLAWLLCFGHTCKRLDVPKAPPKCVCVPVTTGQPGSLDAALGLSVRLCCPSTQEAMGSRAWSLSPKRTGMLSPGPILVVSCMTRPPLGTTRAATLC